MDDKLMAALFYITSTAIDPETGEINLQMEWPHPDEPFLPSTMQINNLRVAKTLLEERIAELEQDSGDVVIGVPTARLGLVSKGPGG